MKIKIIFGILCIFLVAAAIFWVYGRVTTVKEANLIRVGYLTTCINCAPFYVASAKGFFSEHNVAIEPVLFASGGEVRLALSGGQIDVAFAGATSFFTPISKGVPIKIISPMAFSSTSLYVRSDNKTKTFQDLVGKSIGTSLGGSNEYDVRRVLKLENISFGEVNFVNVDKANRLIALMEKKIVDGVPVDYEEWALYSETGAVPLEEWETKGYSSQYIPRSVIAIDENFKNSNPQLTERFIDALIEGHKYMKSNLGEAAGIVSSYLKNESDGVVIRSPEDLTGIWETGKLKYNLWFDPITLVDMSKLAVEMGQLNSSLTLDQIYDLSFETKLNDAQNEIYPTD